MGDYNFGNLSPYDFEIFVRDLLTESEGMKFRSFAPGRDKGIDLRGMRSGPDGEYTIVQCKHMLGSTYASLRSKVKEEKVKLDQIRRKPKRYILATTRPLTSENVDELLGILQPYCKTDDDILDYDSLEQLLAKNKSVLKKHYKLWMASADVLDRIMHAGIHNRSDYYLKDLVAKSRTFVQPNAFPEALKILQENHSCIVSGPPGVGKTTLADMLCLDYLANEFELVVISEDVREADDVWAEHRKQVFIYDDFLGRTDIGEKLGKNEDNRIIEFMRRVRESVNHRFILTTREHILKAAGTRYERLDRGDLEPLKCVLEMRKYSELQKGLILYQHLAFSEGISQSDIEDLVSKQRYLEIVRHRNYTPRHITDALADLRRRGQIGKD